MSQYPFLADGESPYGNVDGEEVIALPPLCLRGRTAGTAGGGRFVGMLDLRTMVIRIDDAANPEFWFEIHLGLVPGLQYAPGGSGAEAARAEFEAARE